jgi:hypothetical protein
LPSGKEQLRAYELRVKRKKNWGRKSTSTYDGKSGPDSDSEVDRDSGYNSRSGGNSDSECDADTKAMDIERKIKEFEEAGVTLSNPCDETKAMMEAELERWEL